MSGRRVFGTATQRSGLAGLGDYGAHPSRIRGTTIEAPLDGVAVGESCMVRAALGDARALARARVQALSAEGATLSLLGAVDGLTRAALVMPTGRTAHVTVGSHLLGAVIDGEGRVVGRLSPVDESLPGFASAAATWPLECEPPGPEARLPVDVPFHTGIRVIDGVLTCGVGQRIGIFGAAGAGKSMLMQMLLRHGQADVSVVALVGERGRELSECIAALRASPRGGRTVLVHATSDQPSALRANAAAVATAIAEWLRDSGADVLLFVDSITRHVRALRDVALSAGEPVARAGYPASVFERLPRLLERPGATRRGSVTAFYTVLIESEDESDPVGDEIRSLLDGHVLLSRELAGKGHFPAIDVLRSVSRVFNAVASPAHVQAASRMRAMLALYKEWRLYIELGEYREGQNAEVDAMLAARGELDTFLRQGLAESSAMAQTVARMGALVGQD
ncbi:FliI/YscN family ATPase [Chitinasiproducens palmae]|uniref:ATP synthase in type III secretion protein N n=1 Tax=Chitinasiproducens palmae TaxID=1770053 RepID=A0A1H2PJ17_9BURK|nr:FliI/YscN family ATPase [Chitinasiproducens palmae]SDV46275.1 ATP synthase in type III secretion protein N [Chitinasiproducens palmae]